MTEDDRKAQDKITRLDIAKRIRHWRQEAGLKQFELAERIGRSEATVSRWENAEHDVAPVTALVHRIAEACGVSMQIFWGRLPQQEGEAG